MKASITFYKGLFILAIVILLILTGITYRQLQALRGAEKWVVHTYQVNIGLDQLLSDIRDAGTGQGGYIITSDSSFLIPFAAKQEKVHKTFQEVKALTIDNAVEQKNFDTLHQLISERFAILSNAMGMNITRAGHDSLKNAFIEIRNSMTKIKSKLDEMHQTENILLKARQHDLESNIIFEPYLSLIALLFSLCILALSYYRINLDGKRLKKLYDDLQITNRTFEHAEEIAGMSHWQWNLATKTIMYSDNHARLLGCEPGEFEYSIQGILEFVHLDDREIFVTRSREALENQQAQPTSFFFRIIRKDGAIRYFKSIGQLTSNLKGDKILIGITLDITEQHLAEISLEEKNRELEVANEELESFNYLASHDLQEPIRKIQTFISRIIEKEKGNVSESTMDYFSRMQMSAFRMQKLIEYLLMYSRTNRTDQVFEETDLNVLVEHAKQELSLVIEEKKAVIVSDKLPVLRGITSQIQQLFINIIGNSLKYSKPDIAPIIKIHSETINSEDVPGTGLKAKQYYKITISDNGIGFEQEYAESIFQLFHRLHEKNEFSRSGIGLAICKKIAGNHDGFIKAESKPDEGASFDIYFPKES